MASKIWNVHLTDLGGRVSKVLWRTRIVGEPSDLFPGFIKQLNHQKLIRIVTQEGASLGFAVRHWIRKHMRANGYPEKVVLSCLERISVDRVPFDAPDLKLPQEV